MRKNILERSLLQISMIYSFDVMHPIIFPKELITGFWKIIWKVIGNKMYLKDKVGF